MNIGFDLDKIFINYPPFLPGWMIEKLYKKRANGELQYRIPSGVEQRIRQISHYYLFRPPIQKNIDIVRKITKDKSNKYYLISSRFNFLEKQTNVVIRRYGIDKLFAQLYFNVNNQQPHVFKDQQIKRLKIDIYIDDDLPLLKYLSNNNKNTHFYWFNTHKNQSISNNLFAITDISKIQW